MLQDMERELFSYTRFFVERFSRYLYEVEFREISSMIRHGSMNSRKKAGKHHHCY